MDGQKQMPRGKGIGTCNEGGKSIFDFATLTTLYLLIYGLLLRFHCGTGKMQINYILIRDRCFLTLIDSKQLESRSLLKHRTSTSTIVLQIKPSLKNVRSMLARIELNDDDTKKRDELTSLTELITITKVE